MEFEKEVEKLSKEASLLCRKKFEEIESIEEINSRKVLESFIEAKVSETNFAPTTGYGYGDRGREKIDELFSCIFHTEDAIVRHGLVSGTHALSTALFGVLRPGDKILSVTGIPYDTMLGVINGEGIGSLKDFGIQFSFFEESLDSETYFENLRKEISKGYKAIYLQRSRGYSLRKSLLAKEIGEIIEFVKKIDSSIIAIVDNCYGEFAEPLEPSDYSADLIIGSLIKNPGGGIASCGGYIAGKRNLIELCAQRFTAPGIGKEVGASLRGYMDLFMGVYNAPQAVAQALKTAVFASALFELMGYEVYPKFSEPRADIVQSIVLGSERELVLFCQSIQSGSPIDSFVSPEPWEMPGYENKVVMAAGNFISGSSIELSADAPIRPPYAVWVQGGTCFYSAKVGILKACEKILNKNLYY